MFVKGQRTKHAFSEGVLEITVNNPKNGVRVVNKFIKGMKNKGWDLVFGKYLNLKSPENFQETIILDYSLTSRGRARLDKLRAYSDR